MDVSDHHSIFDIASGFRLNEDNDIFLDQFVWLGRDVRIQKGATVGREVVIGQSSIVSGVVPPNCICAGVPAKVLKDGVTWSRQKAETLEEVRSTKRYEDHVNDFSYFKSRSI